MDFTLTANEVRVLGSLVEKHLTTPEYYPLTLNALLNACNQKTNRDPVTSLTEDDLLEALESLRAKGLTLRVSGIGARAPKHRHELREKLKLSNDEMAALCVLMLRGPQTPGEIRGRTDRMADLPTLEAAEETLELLVRHAGGPLAVRLPRQPGQKECRYAHLLAGTPEAALAPETATASPLSSPQESVRAAGADRIGALEAEVGDLRGEVTALREELAALRKQFE